MLYTMSRTHLILALCFIYIALRIVRVWYVRRYLKSAYACVIHTTCNLQLQCGFDNWKASLLCRASTGFPNRKLFRATSDYFSAAMYDLLLRGENITEAVPESSEETAEKVNLSTLVDISILIHARCHTPSQISGENPDIHCILPHSEGQC